MATVLILILIVLFAGASLASVALFTPVGEWERLSFVGSTYGAVSALIATLALVGVVFTLVLQARETKRAVEETRRQATSDLLKMAMEDPDLDACWGPVPEPNDPVTRKQRLYTNMIVGQWATAFETRTLPEQRLRAIANEMFHGEPGQAFWAESREAWLANPANDTERRFTEILDEEYRRAKVAVRVEPAAGTKRPSPRSRTVWWTAGGFLAGTCAAAAAAAVAASRRSRERAPSGRRGGSEPASGPVREVRNRLTAGRGR
ncbi:hypothetical protein FHX37_4187 [Haloactinospora alba]|uniref:Uncharacterized protein n=1 Tax=Haloactinospora alba TaxID=405555 RepID=A0A543NAE4_9ACTN|nr:DUF6082 family protein [Haloactinospora alba]TQN28822.1 hypothetical protein FHX37_4187 [Haloactinospora alba]